MPGKQLNVLRGELEKCSTDPMTGFTREGDCGSHPGDHGKHFVCALMTEGFLEFSKRAGNDLSTPMPEFGFPGLRPGDHWCLCAPRWQEALEAGHAPKVRLAATHLDALEVCSLGDLIAHASDVS